MSAEQGHRRLDWAFDQEDCDSTAKLLLVCMAKLGNRNGTCFMRISRLAEMVCASVKTVQRAIRRLLAARLIFEVRPKGAAGRRTKTYSFGCDGAPKQTGQTVPSHGDKLSSGKRQNDAQNPLNHKNRIARRTPGSRPAGIDSGGEAKPIGAVIESLAVGIQVPKGSA